MDKYTDLTADALTHQEPGSVVSRFVGDVDTVENLFTSGIISMFSDACKIVSILAVIWFRNKGLAIVLLVLLPFLFWFTRIVQKNMLTAQIENRRAVSRALGHVPQTIHNGGCGGCHAFFGFRQCECIKSVWNVGWYGGRCHELYFADLFPGGEPWNGDPDHTVCCGGRAQDQ